MKAHMQAFNLLATTRCWIYYKTVVGVQSLHFINIHCLQIHNVLLTTFQLACFCGKSPYEVAEWAGEEREIPPCKTYLLGSSIGLGCVLCHGSLVSQIVMSLQSATAQWSGWLCKVQRSWAWMYVVFFSWPSITVQCAFLTDFPGAEAKVESLGSLVEELHDLCMDVCAPLPAGMGTETSNLVRTPNASRQKTSESYI